MDYFAHNTAIIDDGAYIGEGTQVWHWVHICPKARIGKNVSLGQGVFIGNNVVIGNDCKIQNSVSVFDNVTLQDRVFCGPSMVFTNVINPRAFVDRKSEFKDTLVKKGASLGANCTIVCGVTIGEYALVGAGAVVVKDVKPYALVTGVPAKQTGWVSQFGEKIHLPLKGKGQFDCPHTGQIYTLNGSDLTCRENGSSIY